MPLVAVDDVRAQHLGEHAGTDGVEPATPDVPGARKDPDPERSVAELAFRGSEAQEGRFHAP
jgi:hypothetical protein